MTRCPCSDHLIVYCLTFASRIPRYDIGNSLETLENTFHAPEAALCKNCRFCPDRFHHTLFFRRLRNGGKIVFSPGMRNVKRSAIKTTLPVTIIIFVLSSLLLENLKEIAIPFLLQFIDGNETQGRGVDTVTKSGWRGAVIEYMSEMGICTTATYFGSYHPE
jgi:hypothetical protein